RSSAAQGDGLAVPPGHAATSGCVHALAARWQASDTARPGDPWQPRPGLPQSTQALAPLPGMYPGRIFFAGDASPVLERPSAASDTACRSCTRLKSRWRRFERIPGRRAEALDCLVYAHAARAGLQLTLAVRETELAMEQPTPAQPTTIASPLWPNGDRRRRDDDEWRQQHQAGQRTRHLARAGVPGAT